MLEHTRLLSCLPEKESQRLDHFVSTLLSGVSRRDAKRACEAGGLLLNGRSASPGHAVRSRDQLSILIKLGRVCARPELFANGRYDLKDYFEVVYEDELIVLVDKWAGAHSVTLSLEDSPTLADALAAYCPACAEASPDNREAGLVQRLDRPTRGLLLAAKNRNAWAALRRQFAEKIVDKTYLALVEGIVPWDEQELRGDLVARAERMWVEPGDTAAGEVSVVWRSKSKGSSLVRLRSNKGQRHQVRAHLAHLGFPLLGDSLYGSKLSFQAAEHGISQESDFFLLASELAFQHPETGKRLAFYTKQEAPTATK